MKIKICGLTSPEEANYVNKHLIDFAGIVLFFPKSKRNCTVEQAKEIIAALKEEIKPVAVVVSPTLEQVKVIEQAGFSYIQIHGNLADDVLEQISIPVLRAFNVKDIENYEKYRNCSKIVGYVFDAQEPGSGKTFDWKLVEKIPRDGKMLLLAGGINADNVQDAMAAIMPDGVDCSSGVEYGAQVGKDPEKIDAFVKAVRGFEL